MTDEVLIARGEGPVLVVTLNRPAKANAINRAVIDALDALATSIEGCPPPEGPAALVVTGAGDKAFSAGADVADLAGLDRDAARAQMRRGQAVFGRLEALPIVVVAAINGLALGGGLELAMAADLRVAAPSARLGQPEITLANLPGWGGTQRLPRLVGLGRAKELILTGKPVSARRAYEIGLVDRVAEDPLASAVGLAGELASHSPEAVAGAKAAIAAGLAGGFAAGLLAEAEAVALCCTTEAQHRAVAAFLARRAR